MWLLTKMYKEQVKEQVPALSYEQILCEPARRNTAPCIAYANYKIMKRIRMPLL